MEADTVRSACLECQLLIVKAAKVACNSIKEGATLPDISTCHTVTSGK